MFCIQSDNVDLALDLRIRTGDWGKVISLIQSGAGDDKTLQKAYRNVAKHFAELQDW